MEHSPTSASRLALSATVHCLTGCAIGEVLGLVIATALGWHDLPSVILAIVLAFVFGYGLTIDRSCRAASRFVRRGVSHSLLTRYRS